MPSHAPSAPAPQSSVHRLRKLLLVAAVLSLCMALLPRTALAGPPAPAASPSPANVAAAKQHFEAGVKLYRSKLYREALAEFLAAKKLAPRSSIQQSIAQCYRDLKDFASAYRAYVELRQTYGASMSKALAKKVSRAISDLQMLTGSVVVQIQQPGASVEIDGTDSGTTPIKDPIRLNLGQHDIRITHPGFEALERRFELNGDDQVVVKGPLVKVVTTGHLVVDAVGGKPAHLILDGKDVGALPWAGDVAPGIHSVEAHGQDLVAPSQQVEVVLGKTLEVHLALHSTVSTLVIDAKAPHASIQVDGKVVGSGKWQGKLKPGQHHVVVTKAGFQPVVRDVDLAPGETRNLADIAFVPPTTLPPAVKSPPDYKGLYSDLVFFGAFPVTKAHNVIAEQCPPSQVTPVAGSCTTSTGVGGGVGLRIGYSTGILAGEGVILGAYDYSVARTIYGRYIAPGEGIANSGPARRERYRFHRYGGGVALGARVTSKNNIVRFTAGVDFGFLVRAVRYAYDADPLNGGTDHVGLTSPSHTYVVPASLVDVGIMLGSTPGTKLILGGQMIIEFSGKPRSAPGEATQTLDGQQLAMPSVQVAHGTDIFLGPVLGLQFGQ